jgi:hypothetical protein
MDYHSERHARPLLSTPSRSSAARYLHAIMTSAVALGFIGEGLWLGHDPGFGVGGALAGTLIALGILGLTAGLSWLAITLRNRDG